ncbi:acyl-CoA synthetase [Sodalis ligni]|uniref:acyl-CoA synthetase n=1 Tax=Sodalis ligni TaxID=2697027 RepID=UPI00193F6688|nr:acyl-CoA synthetase [Sodalis ligni]QWA12506.1 acyl-CoA synthetase [Sodalis ligni]
MNTPRPLALAEWLAGENDRRIVADNGKEQFTLAQMRGQVQALCRRLLALSQRRWALCFEDSYLFTVALLASLHAGKIPVIPGHIRQSLLQEQSDDFDGVITDADLTLSCPVLGVERYGVDTGLRYDGPSDAGLTNGLPGIDPTAYLVLFTSGSTGKPRQVNKPVQCLDEESRWLARLWGTRLSGCHFVASVSHQHLYGLTFRVCLPMALALSFDSRQVLYSEQLACHTPDRRYAFISSPAFLRRLDMSLQSPGCRLIVSAGGPLPWVNADAARRWFSQTVDEIYGSTETGVLAWRSRQEEHTPWRPFPGVSLTCDDGECWRARSPLIPMEQGLKLDDKLSFDPAGGFQLCGRHDRIVKIEDKRISLSEVERRLLALPEVADAVALQVVRPGRSGVGVVLVLRPPAQAADLPQLKRRWRHELHQWLEPVAMPRFWRIIDVIPHNSQSKRAWAQIQELFHAAR